MRKHIATLILFIIAHHGAQACDVCGCSLGGSYFGLLPLFNKNFAGLRWSQAKFHAYMNHPSEYLPEEYSDDTYRKVELWGRFNVSPKVQLFAFIPYVYNDMDGSHQQVKSNGLGDITVLASYLLVPPEDGEDVIKHMMTLSGGIKVPTGKFDQQDNGKLVNPNFQLGTGSTDFILSALYNLRYKNAGVNVETGYKINTQNADDYRFGNQLHVSAQLFYSVMVGSFTLLPNAGIYFEHARHHRDDHVIVTNTGGSATFISTGLETYWGSFSLGVNHKLPAAQHYNSDSIADIEAKDRVTVSMTYSF